MVTGDGRALSEVLLADEHLAGIHFTGSTATFQHLWGQVGAHIGQYRGYPRLVGETGGKDFVLAHPSAEVDVLRTALVRGAYEYSGQKCSRRRGRSCRARCGSGCAATWWTRWPRSRSVTWRTCPTSPAR